MDRDAYHLDTSVAVLLVSEAQFRNRGQVVVTSASCCTRLSKLIRGRLENNSVERRIRQSGNNLGG